MYRNGLRPRHGTAAIVAVIFLVLIATIALATFWASSVNTRIGYNIQAMEHSVANAETGVRWITDRFVRMARPRTLEGKVTPAVAARLWGRPGEANSIVQGLVDDVRLRSRSQEQAYWFSNNEFQTAEIWLDSNGRNRFSLTIAPDAEDSRVLHVTSTGYYGRPDGTLMSTRSVRMDYLITKYLPYAGIGNNQVQIGANTLIEGDIAMRTVLSDKRSPVLCVSDFNHMVSIRNQVERFRSLLAATEGGNRVGVRQEELWDRCLDQGFADLNGDNFIDEYDIFLKVFDRAVVQGDIGPTVTKDQEFNEDLEWFKIVNLLGKSIDPDKPNRNGYGPLDGSIDDLDRYAKIRGRLLLGEAQDALLARLQTANVDLAEAIQGPIAPPNPADAPVLFGAEDQIVQLQPEDFRDACARLRDLVLDDLKDSGNPSGKTIANRTITPQMASLGDARAIDPEEVVKVTSANGLAGRNASEGNEIGNIRIENDVYIKKRVLDQMNQSLPQNRRATYAMPVGNCIIERFPYGATSVQATINRPVYRGMTFRKCRIPKGLNALFVECTFEDVTFIDTDETVGGATNEIAGKSWAESGSSGFSKAKPLVGAGVTPGAGEIQTNGSKLGNNLRFESCSFEGPLVGTVPKAYTHHANSWEFNGVSPGTMFDNQWLDPNSGETSATIISPQVNIEMGSFSSQNATSELKGVVVGGNVDIRGKCIVDGCLMSLRTGSGTMTLGYFGPGDDDNDPSAMPEGGFGSILLRANPLRTLPYGINIPVLILPAVETYQNLN